MAVNGSLFNLIFISSDEHTCVNASIEGEAFYRGRSHMYLYYRFMIVYPAFNLMLHLLCLHVFRRMRSKSVLLGLLVGLSAAEVFFQSTITMGFLLLYFMETGRLQAGSYAGACLLALLLPVSFVLVTAGHIARNWAVLLVAAMRFEFVCRHSWKRYVFRSRRLAPKIAAVWGVALVTAAPRFFEMQVYVCAERLKVVYLQPYMQPQPWYMYGYTGGFLALMQNVGPVLMVCGLSACLLRVLCRQRAIRRGLRSATRSACNGEGGGSELLSSRGIDLLVSLLCVTFAICELPSFLKVVDTMHERLYELGIFMNVMTCVDSTLNFFIYLVTNPEFRATMLHTCCCRLMTRWVGFAQSRFSWIERQSTFERTNPPEQPVPDQTAFAVIPMVVVDSGSPDRSCAQKVEPEAMPLAAE